MIVVPIAVIVVLAFLGLVPKNQAARLQVMAILVANAPVSCESGFWTIEK